MAAYIDKEHSYSTNIRCLLRDEQTPGNPQDSNFLGGSPRECPLNIVQISRLALQHVSQYIWSKKQTSDTLREAINYIYNDDRPYQPNCVHKFLADLPQRVSQYSTYIRDLTIMLGPSGVYPLIVTTCFDKTLERAFQDVKQPFDLVSYVSSLKKFIYQKFDHETEGNQDTPIIKKSVELITDVAKRGEVRWLQEHPVILRLYGPAEWESKGDNFAVTEDHFLNYLASRDLSYELPIELWNKLINSHIWFLGYSLNYWNFRLILYRIKSSNDFICGSNNEWWAIQENSEILDEDLWRINGIALFKKKDISSLEDYIKELNQRLNTKLQELPQPNLEHPFDQSEIAYDHRFNQPRLKEGVDDLQHHLELLSEKLREVTSQDIVRTRSEEKFRLSQLIKNTKTQCDQIEEQLKDMESQLGKVVAVLRK